MDSEYKNNYTSKTKRGECKNEGCTNARRNGSAYCQSCSERHQKLQNNK